jgi:hypothetical protein
MHATPGRRIARLWLAALTLLAPTVAWAADIELEQNVLTLGLDSGKHRSVQIFPAEHTDPANPPAKYYYIPEGCAPTTDSNGTPSILLVKYNIPADVGYSVADLDGQKVRAKQGGYLMLEASFSLPEHERVELEKKLKKLVNNEAATLALMPLDKATVVLEYIDPAAKPAKVTIGPEAAPLFGANVSWLIPLSKPAADIMHSVLSSSKGGRAFNVRVNYEFSGYTSPLAVEVTGNWNNIYRNEAWNLVAEGGLCFFRASANMQKVFEQLQKNGALSVKWRDGRPTEKHDAKDVEKLVDILTTKLVDAMFDQTFFIKEDAPKAEKPSGWFGGAGFAWKSVERVSKGQFRFDFQRKEKVVRPGAGFADFSDLKFNKADNIHEVEGDGEWGLIAPRVFVNADMTKYRKILVTVRYGQNTPPYTIPFSESTGSSNQVPREWNPDKRLTAEEKYAFEYKVEAQLKDGAYPLEQIPRQTFTTDWIKTDKPFVIVRPEIWNGPRPLKLKVGVSDDMDAKNVDAVTVQLNWPLEGGKTYTKLIRLKGNASEQLFETVLAPTGPYTAKVSWRRKGGRFTQPILLNETNALIATEELDIQELPQLPPAK